MKTINYFPHDFFARNDVKLVKLRMEMGNKGIGIYWCIVEMLYEEGGKIELQNINAVAFGINEDATNVQQVIQQYNLFELDEKYFWSERVLARLKNIKKVSKARQKAGKASGEARKDNKSEEHIEVLDSQINTTEQNNGTNVEQMLNICSTKLQQSVETKSNNININENKKEKKDNYIKVSKDTMSPKGDETLSDSIEPKEEKIDIGTFVDFWNKEVAPTTIPKLRAIEGDRLTMLNARVKTYGKEGVYIAVKKMVASPFLTGLTEPPWLKCTFDWFIRPRNFPKVLEGNYDNIHTQSNGNYNRNNSEIQKEQRYYEAAGIVNRLLAEDPNSQSPTLEGFQP